MGKDREALQESGAMNDPTDDGGRCPFPADPAATVTRELDPSGPGYPADPFAVFARARQEGRVFHSEELGQCLVTRATLKFWNPERLLIRPHGAA